jgi:arsenate reductase
VMFRAIRAAVATVPLITSRCVAATTARRWKNDYGTDRAQNVMFLCNHNSCRSQMAHGWTAHLADQASVGVASAGIESGTGVHPGAVTVMAEVGIDISKFTSDAMVNFDAAHFSRVVSCCGCGTRLDTPDRQPWADPVKFEDWNLDDPPAIDSGDLAEFRRVRDELRVLVVRMLDSTHDQ